MIQRVILLFLCGICCLSAQEKPFIVGDLNWELGNQLFQVAAAMAIALDHNYEAYFPKLEESSWWGLSDNRRYIFWRLNAKRPLNPIEYTYRELWVGSPIEVHPNMQLEGYFQSEKYFGHHKQEILKLFSPSEEVLEYLYGKYAAIIAHPNSVAIHVRTYFKDYGHLPRSDELHTFVGIAYYERAVKLFPEDTLFVLCSDSIDWCKSHLGHLAKNLVFIEGNHYIYDFYLMSLCKHNIMANSTFSWWAAYLNCNPSKVVITPQHWFGMPWDHVTEQIVLSDWIRIGTEIDP